MRNIALGTAYKWRKTELEIIEWKGMLNLHTCSTHQRILCMIDNNHYTLDSKIYVDDTAKPSKSKVRMSLCLLPGDSNQQNSRWNAFSSVTFFDTSQGHAMYMPPGNMVIWKPPSKTTRLSDTVPVQWTFVVTSVPLTVEVISCWRNYNVRAQTQDNLIMEF